MIICLDAGHGGEDPGAVNGAKQESVAALAITKLLSSALTNKGYEVISTRTTDTFVMLQDRSKLSNNSKADMFISIHLNAATNRGANGIETWRYGNAHNTSEKLATNVQAELIRATGAKDRGVKATTTLYVLKHTKAPAILVECGFISNDNECQKLFDPTYQSTIADAIAQGVENTIKSGYGV